MNDDETVELVDEITDLLESNGITTPDEWAEISQRVQVELAARGE